MDMLKGVPGSPGGWYQKQSMVPQTIVCGYCGDKVSPDRGYKVGSQADGSGAQIGGVFICPGCNGAIFISPDKRQFPGAMIGSEVNHLPELLKGTYAEVRRCVSHGAYTSAVLMCRKMLMNIAVDQGAKENQRFIEYVNFLADNGYTPPNGKEWVDHIRKKGNEATHEIVLMNKIDAEELLIFVEMLLKFIYEFPNMMKVK